MLKLLVKLIAAVAILIVSLFGGVLASGVYTRLRYPDVPVHETDVFFDIGFVFILGFAGSIAAVIGCLFRYKKHHAVAPVIHKNGSVAPTLTCSGPRQALLNEVSAQIAIQQAVFDFPRGFNEFGIAQPLFSRKPAKPFCFKYPHP